MAIDKKLLRMAICDGMFGKAVTDGQGNYRPTPVTPDVLEKVAGMTEEEINANLVIYKSKKLEALNAQKAKIGQTAAQIDVVITDLS